MNMVFRGCWALLLAALLLGSSRLWPRSGGSKSETSSPTAKRVGGKVWWPTTSRGDGYVGAASCAPCHQDLYASQQKTRMAHASRRASDTVALTAHTHIQTTQSGVETVIATDTRSSTYMVRRGGDTLTGKILWTMGDGRIGQTFILQTGEGLFESELSYYPAIQGLDLTPGHTAAVPRDLQHALGERQSAATAQACFGCHTTASSVREKFDPERAIPGVNCEACHGPGAAHIQAMKDGRVEDGRKAIVNPATLDAREQVDFCGACHRTAADVKAEKDFVPLDIRFQPYRLTKSRCWTNPDVRLTCIACHDPHEDPVQDVRWYDAKCLACHAKGPKSGNAETGAAETNGHAPACPVKTERCVSCHMPRYQVAPLHSSFTDHFIRIVKPGEAFPL
jgi:hypothetical protein